MPPEAQAIIQETAQAIYEGTWENASPKLKEWGGRLLPLSDPRTRRSTRKQWYREARTLLAGLVAAKLWKKRWRRTEAEVRAAQIAARYGEDV